MATLMQQRRGTTAEWAAANEVLPEGAIGLNETTGQFKMGDGVTPWNSLPYSTMSPTTFDAVGDLLVGTGDNTYAKLPRGTNGQRLSVQADGTLAWVDPGAATVPLTIVDAAGDLIVGSGNDAVTRLAKGANGTRLMVDGAGNLVWAANDSIPLASVTTLGDILYATGAGAVTRLARGATGQVLTVKSDGTLQWTTPQAAAVPLSTVTAAGDLIVASGSGAVTRLAKGGTAGMVLTMVGGNLAWATPSADIPLSTITAAGDLVVGTGAGAATRLAKGADESKLLVRGGALTWVDDSATPRGVIAAGYSTLTPTTASNGAETVGMSINATIVAGRRYKFRVLAGFIRSDNAADQAQLRCRIGSALTGTIIWANWFVQWGASFVAQQQVYEFDFLGAAATAPGGPATSGVGVAGPATVASGVQTFNFTFTKNSGNANAATMNLAGTTTAPSVIMVEDIGI